MGTKGLGKDKIEFPLEIRLRDAKYERRERVKAEKCRRESFSFVRNRTVRENAQFFLLFSKVPYIFLLSSTP